MPDIVGDADELDLPALALSGEGATGNVLGQKDIFGNTPGHDLVLPALVVVSVLGTSLISLPSMTVSGTVVSGGSPAGANLSLPSLTVSGTVAQSNALVSGTLELPALTVTASTGIQTGDLALPALEVTGALVRGANITSGLSLKLPVLSVSGQVTGPGDYLTGSPVLPALKLSAESILGVPLVSGQNVLPGLQVQAQGESGRVIASGDLALPSLGITASGYPVAVMQSGDLVLPMPVLGAIGQGATAQTDGVSQTDPTSGDDVDQVLASEDTASVFNLGNYGATTYRRFRFNSFANSGSTTYACKTDGIYELTGTTDATDADPAQIASVTTLPIFTLSATQARIRQLWVNGRTQKAVQIRVTSDDQTPYDYQMEPNHLSGLYRNRVKCGKGLRGTNYQIRMASTGQFRVESLEVDAVVVTGRRT